MSDAYSAKMADAELLEGHEDPHTGAITGKEAEVNLQPKEADTAPADQKEAETTQAVNAKPVHELAAYGDHDYTDIGNFWEDEKADIQAWKGDAAADTAFQKFAEDTREVAKLVADDAHPTATSGDGIQPKKGDHPADIVTQKGTVAKLRSVFECFVTHRVGPSHVLMRSDDLPQEMGKMPEHEAVEEMVLQPEAATDDVSPVE